MGSRRTSPPAEGLARALYQHPTRPADVHAGRLHALLAGLDCLHDTPLIFAKRDMSEIRSWLIHMAREESVMLRLAFDPTAMSDEGDAQ
jgi:hypothetical protein